MTAKQGKSNTTKQSASKMIRYAFRIPAALKKRIDNHIEASGVKHQSFGKRALEEKLDREEGRAA